MSRPKIVCQCGGEISRPVPSHCPHCGAQIVGFRQSKTAWLWPVLLIGAIFTGLVAALILLAER